MITPPPHQETSQPVDPFSYDYETLRLVGMILASIMFVMGILIALSKKLRCKKSDPGLSDPQSNRQESHSTWHRVGTVLKMSCSRVADDKPRLGLFSGDLGTDCLGGEGSLLSNLKEGGALL